MNTSRIWVLCTMMGGLSAFSVFANDAPTTCSLESLRGTVAGTFTGSNAGVANSASGMESYDGAGHMKWIELWSDGYTAYRWHGTGTYTITPGCVATVIYGGNISQPWTYFVSPDGSGYYWNNNGLYGEVASGRMARISTALLVQ